ncbi:MAG: hypothetical protein IJY60_02930 [Bacteroides sp.]|nr:hypothetical protein [Bacteroides sp.]MBQ8874250.1 hypothetical protein [Bacteroides sp.]
MKKRIIFCVLCSLLGVMAQAQHQQLFDEFRKEVGDQAEMFAGKVEPGYPPTIYTNHPYWMSSDFVSGDVMFNGRLYRSVPLRFDAFLQQLVVNTPVKRSNVIVPMEQVEKFIVDGIEYSRRNDEFVAILYSSPRMELVEKVHVTVKEGLVDNARVQYEFKRNVKYYLLRGGQMLEVGNLKSVMKLFPGLKKELKSFAKMHYLDFKVHRQSSLISTIKYADGLLNNR